MTNASILTMMAISFERYYAICRPLEVLYTCTKRRAGKIIGCLWAFSVSVSVPFIWIAYQEPQKYYDGNQVQKCNTPIDTPLKAGYIWASFALLFIAPCLVLAFLYCRICRELMRDGTCGSCHGGHHRSVVETWIKSMDLDSDFASSTHAQTSRDIPPKKYPSVASRCSSQYSRQRVRALSLRRQVIYMLIATILFSLTCMFPLRIVTIWYVYASSKDLESLGAAGYLSLLSFSRIIFYLNSAGNPILYNMISTKFRAACKQCLLNTCGRSRRHHGRHRIGRRLLATRGSMFTRSLRSQSTKADVLELESQQLPMANVVENGFSSTTKKSFPLS